MLLRDVSADRAGDASTLPAALATLSDALGLSLTVGQGDQLMKFLAMLQRWNGTYNLTAVRDPAQMMTQHLADCLAVVPALRMQMTATSARRVLDVGSGGGLPGAVLAILHEALTVTCVDTVGKKAAFIRQVALELGLRNLHAEHARVEKLTAAPFDIITSRAFASLADFVSLTRRHLGPGAVWMAMKGKRPLDEIAGLPADIDVFHVEPLAVPGLAADRCLVWMRPRPASL
jgi:16S rRNA (guanine527-N7)-methyltransferase